MHDNRFDLLSEDEDSDEDCDLTLSDDNMMWDVEIQYNKEENKRNRKLRKDTHKVKKDII